jgi:hypothetical protein
VWLRLATTCFLLVLAGGHARSALTGTPGVEQPPAVQLETPDSSSPPPAPCGAIAYTADGAFGAAYGMSTCEVAERLAVDACVKVAIHKDDCAKGVIRAQEAWFHIQFCRQGNNYTTRVTTNHSLADTSRDAAAWAEQSNFGIENCRLLTNGLFHSGGLHTKI